jgi:hypothetical protein
MNCLKVIVLSGFVSLIFCNCTSDNGLKFDQILNFIENTKKHTPQGSKYSQNYKEVVQKALTDGLVHKDMIDYGLLKDNRNVIVSNHLIDESMLPDLDSIKITILPDSGIKSLADKNGDFIYLKFVKIDCIDDTTYIVSLATNWMRSSSSDIIYLSGGWIEYKYIKSNNIWNKILIAEAIS